MNEKSFLFLPAALPVRCFAKSIADFENLLLGKAA